MKVSGVALLMIAVLGLIAFQAIWQQAPFWQSALLFALLVVVVAVGIGSYTRLTSRIRIHGDYFGTRVSLNATTKPIDTL